MGPESFDPSVALIGLKVLDDFNLAVWPSAFHGLDFGLFSDSDVDQSLVGAKVSFAIT